MKRLLGMGMLAIGPLLATPGVGAAQRVALDVEVATNAPSLMARYVNTGFGHLGATLAVSLAGRGAFDWIAAGQGFLSTAAGEDLDCAISPVEPFCVGHIDILARGALLTGVAARRETATLRLLGGVMLFDEEERGLRPAPTVRVDLAYPANRRVALLVSASRAMLGSLYGRNLTISTFAIGARVRTLP